MSRARRVACPIAPRPRSAEGGRDYARTKRGSACCNRCREPPAAGSTRVARTLQYSFRSCLVSCRRPHYPPIPEIVLLPHLVSHRVSRKNGGQQLHLNGRTRGDRRTAIGQRVAHTPGQPSTGILRSTERLVSKESSEQISAFKAPKSVTKHATLSQSLDRVDSGPDLCPTEVTCQSRFIARHGPFPGQRPYLAATVVDDSVHHEHRLSLRDEQRNVAAFQNQSDKPPSTTRHCPVT